MPTSRRQRGTRYESSDSESNNHTSRLYTPCPSVTGIIEVKGPIQTCETCNRFCTPCCFHKDSTCHNCRIVCTDGACSNNGKYGATAGIGIALGEADDQQWSLPIDDNLDPGGRRTSQRAELLAAIVGLDKVAEADGHPDNDEEECCVIIATDSEYVVKGMSEWVPTWKARGWRKSDGRRPSNLDLFRKLDEKVQTLEHLVLAHFRDFNDVADRLAKNGARLAVVSEVEYAISAFDF
ncbi:ribonuclease H-like domain-containing protein [Scleroderma citrinum]